MRLTSKLLDFVYRALSADPDAFLAMRLRYAGEMSWSVSDGVLKTEVVGGPGAPLSIGLAAHTFRSLANYLAAQPGYSVPFLDAGAADLSALALLDGSGNQDASNGDHLSAYRSLLYVYLEPVAVELQEARRQVANALEQMNLKTADAEWLDEWGGYYGIARDYAGGEQDADYANRIVAEVLRPRSNNIAIAEAIREAFGQHAVVRDVRLWGSAYPRYDGAIKFNAAETHRGQAIPRYGLFDVDVDYDLLSGADMLAYAGNIRKFVEKMRSAGTQVQSLALRGGSLTDSATIPGDGSAVQTLGVSVLQADSVPSVTESVSVFPVVMAGMSDGVSGSSEDAQIDVAYAYSYSGARSYNGVAMHNSGLVIGESV